MNTVSVIMPTYNRAGYIKDAIESVLNQTYNNFELIIVDDGSQDNTEEVISPYLTRDSRIRYIKQANAGAATARNRGLSMRNGNLVAFIDSDDIWESDKLGIQVSIMDALPEAGIVCSDFSAVKNNSLIERSHIRSYFSVLNDYSLDYHDVFSHQLDQKIEGLDNNDKVYWGNVFATMLFGNIILTSTCLCRSAVFETAGGFDPSFRTLEDYDLYLKITRTFPVALVTKPLIRYQYSENQLSGEEYFGQLCLNLINIFNKNVDAIDDADFLQKNKKKLKKHLGKYQAQQGYFHFSREELHKAAQCYRQSIQNDPGNCQSYIYLFFSLMPVAISRFIRKLKSSMKKDVKG
jgi:glycosyltransferase involved in cell wall biosynthesis